MPSITIQNAAIHLGMTQAEVATELGKQSSLYLNKDGAIANEQFSDSGDVPDRDHFRLYATVKFGQGRLRYVEKYWRTSDSADTALVIMNALFGAATSVAGDGRVCSVRTWTSTEPEEDYKETSVVCDLSIARRSIHAFVKTFHYSRDIHSIQVNEVLESK
jgi:hypothetical protein